MVEFEEIPSSIKAEKSNTYNADNKTLTFTVRVESTGKNNNVRLYDHIYRVEDYGKILKYQKSTLNVTSSKTQEMFSFVTDLENGEVLTFTYDVKVDLAAGSSTYKGNNRF